MVENSPCDENQIVLKQLVRNMGLGMGLDIYWTKVLTDHPKIRDNCCVVKYFETNFGILNENTVWHQSYASAGTWCSPCSCECVYT